MVRVHLRLSLHRIAAMSKNSSLKSGPKYYLLFGGIILFILFLQTFGDALGGAARISYDYRSNPIWIQIVVILALVNAPLHYYLDAVIFKMHGAPDPADEERDSYVITEDDYVEFLARLANQTAIPACFAEPFRRRHFLFLGYGLKDWNLRVILYQVWKEWPRRRYASWAIQHQTEALEREFWSRKQLSIYEMTIADFLARLPGDEDGG